MSQSHSAGCTGIEVFNWRRGSEEWDISWIRHGDSDQPTTEDATNNCDVTIFYSTDLLAYCDSRSGVERDTIVAESENNRCHQCIEYLTNSFEFLTFWWEPVYLDSNGYFGYQDEISEDNAVVSVSMYHFLPIVRYC